MNKQILTLIGLGAGLVLAVGTAAAASTRPPASTVLDVPLGAPVFAQALYYTEMFDEKPFAEALLVYLDNGSYKILSPGEDHYGSYVSNTLLPETPREVRFLSWPSTDWQNNVAAHTLVFNPDSGAFSQHLLLPGASAPLLQYGYSADLPDPGSFDLNADWNQLRERYAGIFDDLANRA